MLKGIAAHYVMRADDRVAAMARQRELLAELVDAAGRRPAPTTSSGAFADDWAAADDDAARRRVVVDQIASLTDASAVAWHARLPDRRRWSSGPPSGVERSRDSGQVALGPGHVVRLAGRSSRSPCPWPPPAALVTLSATTGAWCLATSTACWAFSCTRGSFLTLFTVPTIWS